MHRVKHITKNIWAFIKRKKWWVIIIGAILLVILLLSGGNGEVPVTVAVQRGEIISEVSVTGQVKPSQSIDLAFEKGGRIGIVPVEVGDEVRQGDRLVSLENGDLVAQLAQAQGALAVQQANLNDMLNGARPEEIAAKKTELDQAKKSLDSYYQNAVNVLNDAYAKADDGVRKQMDDLFTNDEINPELTFQTSNTTTKTNAQWQRLLAAETLDDWKNDITGISVFSDPTVITNALSGSQQHIIVVRDLLTVLEKALDEAVGLSSTTLSTYRANLSTARTNLNTAGTSVTTQQQTIANQILNVERVQNEYNLTLLGATSEQAASQRAQVAQAQAQVDYYASQIEKTILRAPFGGIVTKLSYKKGEIVSANIPVVSLTGKGAYQIETYIAESDIAKVKEGNMARVTLDAYGSNVTFEAIVTNIDLSETILEGVATYKAILQFTQDDERILPGLTANVDIMSDRKENVLYLPTRNIISKNGKTTVYVSGAKEEKQEVEIEVGLRGSDGRTEIISGLNQGDVIIAE